MKEPRTKKAVFSSFDGPTAYFVRGSFIRGYSLLQQANTLRSFDSAERICVLTVPTGALRISAICS